MGFHPIYRFSSVPLVLQLFRNSQPIAVVVLFLYAFLVRGLGILYPPTYQINDGGWLAIQLRHLLPLQGATLGILSTLLILLQGVLLSNIANRFKLAKTSSFFVAVFYILLLSCFREHYTLSPVLLANTFFIWALNELFSCFREYQASDKIFNAGMLIAIATMLYPSFGIYLLLAIISLTTLRSLSLRDIIVLLSGFIVPFFLAWTYFFLHDDTATLIQSQFTNNIGFLQFNIQTQTPFYQALAVWSVAILWIILNAQSYLYKTGVHIKKISTILFWAIFIAILSIFVQGNICTDHLILISAPLALFTGLNFLNINNQPIAELLHLITLATVVYVQYLMLG